MAVSDPDLKQNQEDEDGSQKREPPRRPPPPYLHDPAAPSSGGSDADAEASGQPSPLTRPGHVHRRRRTSRNVSVSSHTRTPSGGEEEAAGDSSSTEEGGDSPEPDEETSVASNEPVKRRKKRKRPADDYDSFLASKSKDIERVLERVDTDGVAAPRDVEALRKLSVGRAGLVSDELRRRVWPLLVTLDPRTAETPPTQEECEKHKEYNQVVLDVNRSLKRFPPGIADEDRPELQDQLTRLIVRVLVGHPDLHYYQGYHDVAITFLLVVGEMWSYRILDRLSVTHLKEFMAPTMERTTVSLNYMYPIIYRMNSELHSFLETSEVGTIFALPWMITWFGHVLPEYEDVVRLYDFFLSQPPLMPVYLAAALVLHRDVEIMTEDCDLAMVHSVLSRIPFNLPFEKLLVEAQVLYEDFPPSSLEKEVKQRMERIERENQMQRDRVKGLRKKNTAKAGADGIMSNWSVVAKVMVVSVPVVLGYVVYKWYSAA